MLLDLDTGRWATNAVYRPDVSEWWDWMCGEGMDMLALGRSVPQTIVCFDLGLAHLENPEWDTLTAADVVNYWPSMTTGGWHQEQLRQDPNTTNTYLFRTREGGRGMLQILGNSTNPPGVQIRYKLVEPFGASGSWQRGNREKEKWQDAGASTPEAALQTLLWAVREKPVDRLEQQMILLARDYAHAPWLMAFRLGEKSSGASKWARKCIRA